MIMSQSEEIQTKVSNSLYRDLAVPVPSRRWLELGWRSLRVA